MTDLLQSDGWEQLQIALGRKTKRVDGILVIEMPLPFGMRYRYSPRSSLPRHLERVPSASFRTGSGESKDPALRVVHGTRAIFWRAECSDERGVAPRVLRRALEPEWTWRTSLEGTDDELLGRMHEKHRYNVRLAAKRGVVVRVVSVPSSSRAQFFGSAQDRLRDAERSPGDPDGDFPAPLAAARSGRNGERGKDFSSCWSLLQDTARRQGIATHPRAYYETMLRVLPATQLYLAEHDGDTIACAIVVHHGDTATYLHGGSSHAHRNLMAPHLLHWTAMRAARAAGMRWYDWGGIAPPDAATHDWDGMTRFKRGFGGEVVHHPPMRDLVFRPVWYTMLATFARLRG